MLSFSGVLWMISPKLFLALEYASLVITQFQAISSYASVITRLGEFVEYAERQGYK